MIVVSYLLVYMLKSAVVLVLLTALYRFTLRRETFHRFNRAVLLGIGALSLALPALTLQAPAPRIACLS